MRYQTTFLAALLAVFLFICIHPAQPVSGSSNSWTVRDGTWIIGNGEFHTSAPAQTTAIATANTANYTDCVVITKLRFADGAGYRAGIVFRYIDSEHYYAFEIGNQNDEIGIVKYSPANGESGAFIQPSFRNSSLVINANVNYALRLEAVGSNFDAYLNGVKVLSWTDRSYVSGLVGLRAESAEAFFDDFAVAEHVLPASIDPTPMPTPTIAPTPVYTVTPTQDPTPNPSSPSPTETPTATPAPSTSTPSVQPTSEPTTTPIIPEFSAFMVLILLAAALCLTAVILRAKNNKPCFSEGLTAYFLNIR